ncbi:DUF1566 domain-containing protein [Treponema sp. OttesenSCG-928-L16]|nr:DUF1566 domain-containing protein [Treponema sp. OttesenSCG-928-L16]
MKRVIFLFPLLLVVSVVSNLQAQQALPRLAVVEFSTNSGAEKVKQDAVTVRNLVESRMIATGKYQIITRDEIDKLLANQQIQISSISSSENIKKLQLQNINYLVTGSVDAMGSSYAVTVKILDVSTGQFSHSENEFMGGEARELYTGVTALAAKFTAGMASSGERVVQTEQPAAPATASGKVYKIGDFGPAGGIVFYDKGIFSNGWRYLEAAPLETEFTAQWGAYQKDVSGTIVAVGGGKRNTQLIVEFLRRQGENGRAAQLCEDLSFDGFSDWFLPSKDELNLMYQNLKTKGLGGFSDSLYWSSSQNNIDTAWCQRFSNGIQGSGNKDITGCVRAVRAF